jgi:hypothetical protein
VVGSNEPAFYLAGPRLNHRVVYLAVKSALTDAYRDNLSYVVITKGPDHVAASTFRAGHWAISSLGGYWQLAVAPHAGTGECTTT